MTITRGVAAALATVTTAGLALAAPAEAAPAVNGGCVQSNTHHLTARETGTRITLLAGQCLQVALLTNTDSGASWYTTEHVDRTVARVVSTKVVYTGKPGVAGAPSISYFLYKRTGAGTTNLRIEEETLGRRHTGDPVFSLTIRSK